MPPKILLVENGEKISDQSRVANSFNNFFENVIHSLDKYSNENYGIKNQFEIDIKKFEQHTSIDLISKNITHNESFHFLLTEQEIILKEISNLDKKMELLKTFLLAVSRVHQVSVALF